MAESTVFLICSKSDIDLCSRLRPGNLLTEVAGEKHYAGFHVGLVRPARLIGAAKHRIRCVIRAGMESRFWAKGRGVRTLDERPSNKRQERSGYCAPGEGEYPTGFLLIDAARDHIERSAREEDQTAHSDAVAVAHAGQFVEIGSRLPVHRDF